MIRSRLPTRKTITENELRTAMVGGTHNLALVFTVINTVDSLTLPLRLLAGGSTTNRELKKKSPIRSFSYLIKLNSLLGFN